MLERFRRHESGIIIPQTGISTIDRASLNGHKAINLEACGGPADLFLVHNAPEAYDPPLSHENSEAKYLIDYCVIISGIRHRVMVSIMPPGACSSVHSHEFPEYYRIHAGESVVYTKGEPRVSGGCLILPPGLPHHVRAKEFTVMQVVLACGDLPEERHHNYHEAPDLESWRVTTLKSPRR